MSRVDLQADFELRNTPGTVRHFRVHTDTGQFECHLDMPVEVYARNVSVGTGSALQVIPCGPNMGGMELEKAHEMVYTPGQTGTVSMMIQRKRNSTIVDMLRANITLGSGYYSSAGVVNSTNKSIAAGDQILIKVPGVHSGTEPLGLWAIICLRPEQP